MCECIAAPSGSVKNATLAPTSASSVAPICADQVVAAVAERPQQVRLDVERLARGRCPTPGPSTSHAAVICSSVSSGRTAMPARSAVGGKPLSPGRR